MSASDNNLNLYQRIIAITEDIKSFGKDGRNDQHGFKYAGIEAVVSKLNEACIRHGVVFIQGCAPLDPETTTHKDRTYNLSRVLVTSTAVNIDNPVERHTETFVGAGWDAIDKGVYKAESGARKNAIFAFFNVHSGSDEPDATIEL